MISKINPSKTVYESRIPENSLFLTCQKIKGLDLQKALYVPVQREEKAPDLFYSSIYQEVTRRIARKKAAEGCLILGQIEEKIAHLPEIIPSFGDRVETGDFDQIVSIPDYPFYALKALNEGVISQDVFATILLPWASKDPRKECIELFSLNEQGEKAINPIARGLIAETMETEFGTLLSEEELDEFFQAMETVHPLHQKFHLDHRVFDDPFSFRKSLRLGYKGLNLFSSCTYENQRKCMIPSASMMQTFLNVKFKQNAVQMNFVLGLSKIGDIKKNGLEGTRDVSIRFPQVFLPNEADELEAEETDFSYHDFFHAFIGSYASLEERRRFILLAELIPEAELEIGKFWRESFIDMEISLFYEGVKDVYDPNLFLIQIYYAIASIDLSHPISETERKAIAQKIAETFFFSKEEISDLDAFIKRQSLKLAQTGKKESPCAIELFKDILSSYSL